METPRARERILVVEDEEMLRTMLTMQLQREGYRVRTAVDGEDALDKIREERPDLVLLDVVMPKLDGYETCRRIKGDMATANIPVIMLTSRADHEDKIRGLRGGANDYVTKPYEPGELLARVRNILQWSMLQREANPLTGLPGNISIENEVRARLAARDAFAFMYIDLDHFKAFNDYYSFRKGDEAIRLVASILLSAVSLEGSGSDFVGHVGGDDFVLVVSLDCADAIAQAVIQEFDAKAPRLYSEGDRRRGTIETHDRQGRRQQFPLMSVTIAAVAVRDGAIEHPGELSRIAAELKAFGKAQPGSVVIWERRHAA
ncbi:MAG: response regulator [Candidatus Eisenbacteria bacterium]|uniref:histidine kinase n=1 Tax=Eiseniibacteriota bacterium TaxID=2212470 RepID=A0A937X9Q7_UNCEI|nr:response regulator [Candidatus Eisenbacteria bacterium]